MRAGIRRSSMSVLRTMLLGCPVSIPIRPVVARDSLGHAATNRIHGEPVNVGASGQH